MLRCGAAWRRSPDDEPGTPLNVISGRAELLAGTGLGPSVSYGIVRDHGGPSDVDRQPGRGTRFAVFSPAR